MMPRQDTRNQSGVDPDTEASVSIAIALRSIAEDDALQIRINGSCMEPLLKDGAVVHVRKQRHYWPGDIVLFREEEGGLISHRLLGAYFRQGQLLFLTKADNGLLPDRAISQAQIIGRIVGGDCQQTVINVPLSTRSSSLVYFVKFAAGRLLSRLRK